MCPGMGMIAGVAYVDKSAGEQEKPASTSLEASRANRAKHERRKRRRTPVARQVLSFIGR